MSSPLEVSVTELLRQAKQLGLVWGFRPATVTKVGTPFDRIDVGARYDGDIETIPMSSLIGPLVVDDRVMVMYIPPNGNYIVGTTDMLAAKPVGEMIYADLQGGGGVLIGAAYTLLFTFVFQLPEVNPRVYYVDVAETFARSDAVLSVVDVKLTLDPGFTGGDVNAENITLGGANWQIPIVAAFNAGGTSALIPGRFETGIDTTDGVYTLGVYAKENVGTNTSSADVIRTVRIWDMGNGGLI